MAIKLLRVKIAVGLEVEVSFEDCRRELEVSEGDIMKASTVLVMWKQNDKK